MKTTSLWKATSNEKVNFPALTKDIEVDVAIIGGGITGIISAMLLSNEGKSVAVTEALNIGLGTTGYSTGNLYVVVDEHLSKIKRKWDKEVMCAVAASRKAALELIENIISKYKVDCNFIHTPFYYFAESPDNSSFDFLNDEFESASQASLSPELVSETPLPFKISKALKIQNQSQFQPLKFIRQLASKMISNSCSIYENSPVDRIEEENNMLYIGDKKVRARHIIMATHTPKGVYAVQSVLAPYREYGVAGTLNNKNYPEGIFWSADEKKHSVRSYHNNGKDYILTIGEKHKTGQEEDNRKCVERLQSYLDSHFDMKSFEYQWGGQHYRSADGLPYIGPSGDGNLYIATGFATDGLIYGALAGILIKDMILKKANRWNEIYDSKRITPMKSAKNFIKENIDDAIQYLKDLPMNVDITSFSELKNGEGKSIEIEGEKCGAYRDDNGKLHLVSLTCTHLKCICNFNYFEKSWDCPCHGSRFDIEGKVLEGPAIRNLKKYKN